MDTALPLGRSQRRIPATAGGKPIMFRLYEYNFSSTIELVTAVLLVVTILAVAFV